MGTTNSKAEWIKQTKAELRKFNKQDSFYTRITGVLVGTCSTTVGYIGKSTFMGKASYYACLDLFHLYQSWQYHCCFKLEINKRVKDKKNKIVEFDSLTEAINYLKLEK